MFESILGSGSVPDAWVSTRARLQRRLGLALSIWVALWVTLAGAVEIQGMPSVEHVMAAAAGRDGLDTAARQRAALLQAAGVVETLSDGRIHRSQLTAQERAWLSAYRSRAREIERRTLAGFDPAETRQLGLNSPRAQWFNSATRLELDAKFRAEVVEPLLTPALREQLRQLTVGQQQAREASARTQRAAEAAAASRARWRAYEPLWSLAVAAALTVVLAFLFYPPRGRPRSEQAGAFLAGRFALEFREVRGVVAALAESTVPNTTVSTHTDANGRTLTSVSTQTEVRQKFFLMREVEHDMVPVHIVDWDVPLANGHDVTVVWMWRPGTEHERMAMLFNHTADRHWSARGETVMDRYRLRRRWSIFGLVALLFSLLLDWNFAVGGAALVLICALGMDVWQGWRLVKTWEAHMDGLASRLRAQPQGAPGAALPGTPGISAARA